MPWCSPSVPHFILQNPSDVLSSQCYMMILMQGLLYIIFSYITLQGTYYLFNSIYKFTVPFYFSVINFMQFTFLHSTGEVFIYSFNCLNGQILILCNVSLGEIVLMVLYQYQTSLNNFLFCGITFAKSL